MQECCLKAIGEGANKEITGRLLDHYYEIGAGIGVHKSPELYGAFPTDPYSHTPMHRGAQQPGMTGQVKEDILVRFGELGVFVNKGELIFNPALLRKKEFSTQEQFFEYQKIPGGVGKIKLLKGQLAFTCCQVPVVYSIFDNENIKIHYANGRKVTVAGRKLNLEVSSEIFKRNGIIEKIEVSVNQNSLR